MKEKTFAPILAPNKQPNLEELKYPLLASYKLDGIRCIFKDGQILSRSLKPIQNKQLREKLQPIREYSEENNLILDGEIYSPNLTFQEITRYVMTQDFEDKKSIKKFGEVLKIPVHLKFYCFDSIYNEEFNKEFGLRNGLIIAMQKMFLNIMEYVTQEQINDKESANSYFKKAMDAGYEGLILRDPNGRYKFGRGTHKEGLIYKIKPFRTFDSQIIDVIQATEVDKNAEKTVNELGYSVTSKKKYDRVLIEKASAFLVKYEGKDLKVVIAMTDEEKEEIWQNREKYIGKWIEYKGMLIGAKEVPRHPVMLRFRKDKGD